MTWTDSALFQILLTNGSLAVYEAFSSTSAPVPSSTRNATLGVRFVKVLNRRLSIPVVRRSKVVDAIPPAAREFVPFHDLASFSGAFITGEDPLWLLATDHGPARLFDHSDRSIYGFTLDSGIGQYLIQSKTVSLFYNLLVAV